MSAERERRYAWLLRLYPAAYRRTHGAELLTTLMESVEDDGDGPLCEVGALVLGALRAHAGRHCRPNMRDSWWAAFRAAAQMLLVYGTAYSGIHLVFSGSHGHISAERVAQLVALVLGGCAVAAASGGRYRTAIVAATAAFVVSLVVTGLMGEPWYGDFSQFPLAIALLVLLSVRRPPAVGGLLRYVPALPLLLVLATEAGAKVLPGVSGLVRGGLLFGLFLAGLLWLAVDERVTMALGLMFLESFLAQVVLLADGVQSLPAAAVAVAITAAFPATLLLAGVGAARHHIRL